MNEDVVQIPKMWRDLVARILRNNLPNTVLIRQRARVDWASMPWNPFDYELLDALAEVLEGGSLNGRKYTMEEAGETYGFIFHHGNFPIYTKINLSSPGRVVIVYSAHRPLKGEHL